jgi:hypothetical protein
LERRISCLNGRFPCLKCGASYLKTTFAADMTAGRKLGTDRTLAKKISRQALLDALVQDALYC